MFNLESLKCETCKMSFTTLPQLHTHALQHKGIKNESTLRVRRKHVCCSRTLYRLDTIDKPYKVGYLL